MTAHELARALLARDDVPVALWHQEDGMAEIVAVVPCDWITRLDGTQAEGWELSVTLKTPRA